MSTLAGTQRRVDLCDGMYFKHGIFFFLFRCSPPEKSNEYQKIYSNWCHEFEKYKTAMKTWERKQEVT